MTRFGTAMLAIFAAIAGFASQYRKGESTAAILDDARTCCDRIQAQLQHLPLEVTPDDYSRAGFFVIDQRHTEAEKPDSEMLEVRDGSIKDLYVKEADRHLYRVYGWKAVIANRSAAKRIRICGWPRLVDPDGETVTAGPATFAVNLDPSAERLYRGTFEVDEGTASKPTPWRLVPVGVSIVFDGGKASSIASKDHDRAAEGISQPYSIPAEFVSDRKLYCPPPQW